MNMDDLIKALRDLIAEGEEGILAERGWNQLHALTEPLQQASDYVEAARGEAAAAEVAGN